MKRKRLRGFIVGIGLIAKIALPETSLASRLRDDDKRLAEEAQRTKKAAQVLEEIMRADDRAIPEGLLKRAYAIAVIPHVVKGAFLAGGRFGKGLISSRDEHNEWGPPAFIEIAGGSFGLQVGVVATDLVMVFIEEDGMRALIDDKLKLGADVSVAAGPLGRHAEVGTNVTLDSAIYSYSRSKGVFAGVSLDGSVISMDDSSNHRVYPPHTTGDDILFEQTIPTPEVTKPFVRALQTHVPPLEETPKDR